MGNARKGFEVTVALTYYGTPAGKLIGVSTDDGETMVNAAGRIIAVPAGAVEVDAQAVPARMQVALEAAIARAETGVAAREQYAAEQAAQRAAEQAQAAQAEERRKLQREDERAYWASPAGKARAAREMDELRRITRALMSVK